MIFPSVGTHRSKEYSAKKFSTKIIICLIRSWNNSWTNLNYKVWRKILK